MSRRVRGRSFKITKNQAQGYGYAKARRMQANPGVTTIAAINGRGSYAGNRSARSVMSKLKRNARPAHARKALTKAQKRAFKSRMRSNVTTPSRHRRGKSVARRPGDIRRALHRSGHKPRYASNRTPSASQSRSSRKNIKKAQGARRAWGRKLPRGKRVRVGRAAYGRKPRARRLKAGVYVANRKKKAGTTTMASRRRKRAKVSKKRRSSKRRRKHTTTARRSRRKSRKGAARRRRKATKTTGRRRRRSKKMVANRRRRSKAASPRRRRRKARKGSARRRRKSTRSRSRRRSSSKRRVSRKRRRSSGRKMKANRRRSHRKNRSSGRKRRSSGRGRHKANRRRHRRNGRRTFRMNGVGDVLKVGAVLFGGFALHRVLTNLFNSQLLPKLLPSAAPAAAPATPAATSGFDLPTAAPLLSSIAVGAITGFAASKMIQNADTKKLVIGGIVLSTMQSVVVSVLKMFAPSAADALAGPEDGRAARLSAMYGLGAGASIMPRYAPINGLGEYFREPVNGLGEYFREPVNGLGEYINATSGLGSYEQNSDLMQAAAGMGAQDYQGNHIDPSGDLDRQLTIAEAAAGVGAVSPFEAAAGIGPMQAAAGMRGMGAIATTPSGDTWIPGTTNPQLWAGVKSIDRDQSATAMVPAGILQADGGSGIFG